MSDTPKHITLEAWAQRRLDPAPSLWTLRRMVREKKIAPEPIKVGREYRVREDADLVDPDRPSTLLDKIRRAA